MKRCRYCTHMEGWLPSGFWLIPCVCNPNAKAVNIFDLKREIPVIPDMSFEQRCREVADVPWEFTGWVARFGNVQIGQGYGEFGKDIVTCLGGKSQTFVALDRHERTEADFRAARTLIAGELALGVARLLLPNAPWRLERLYDGPIQAVVGGLRVQLLTNGNFIIAWAVKTAGSCGTVAASAAELVAWFENRQKAHNARRGPKRVKGPKSQRVEWKPNLYKNMTPEHARNILLCLAQPWKYTRIARWAEGAIYGELPILVHKALKAKPPAGDAATWASVRTGR